MIAVGGRDRRAGNGLQRGGGDEKRQHQAAIPSSNARSISAISGSRDRRCSPSFILHVCTSAARSLLAKRSAISTGNIGRAHVCTPATNAPLVRRSLLEKN